MNGGRWSGVAVIATVATIAVAFLAATSAQRSTVITQSSAGNVLRRDDIARIAREQKNAVVSLHTLRGGSGTQATPRLWVEPLGGSGNVGLNFAIPTNTVKAVLPQLRAGRAVHGWLGVVSLPMNATGARRFGLRSPSDGLYVQDIAPAGPADRAGLRTGDVLLGMVEGTPVNARDLHTKLRQLGPGAHVTLRVLRDGRRIELPVVIGTSPSSQAVKR